MILPERRGEVSERLEILMSRKNEKSSELRAITRVKSRRSRVEIHRNSQVILIKWTRTLGTTPVVSGSHDIKNSNPGLLLLLL